MRVRVWVSLLALASLLAASLLACVDAASHLTCGVCEAIVDEVNHGIASTERQHSVQTRFRIDEKKRVPYARTEHNLLEIVEGESFLKRFDSYSVVKPATKSHSHLRRAYQLRDEGKPVEPLTRRVKKDKKVDTTAAAPAAAAADAEANKSAEVTPAATTDAPASSDTSASTAEQTGAASTPSAESTQPTADASAPADAAASSADAAAPAVVEEVDEEWEVRTYAPFTPPLGEVLPLSLAHGHAHLVRSSTAREVGLVADSNSRVRSEIRSSVSAFLEEHLDEALLLFHRDVPELKRKLCGELTEACAPNKKKKGKGKKDAKKAEKKASSSPAADKDEL